MGLTSLDSKANYIIPTNPLNTNDLKVLVTGSQCYSPLSSPTCLLNPLCPRQSLEIFLQQFMEPRASTTYTACSSDPKHRRLEAH
ncbi:uncharacterized protein BT62DRAFT_932957 [Guyanagaster necrorhizus]|uniref:Uncharacterized protein n=1 Tax=Guyanagaster necrorhizus TaxID=856835 RepID=A0A9P7VSF0_9AGAR|nr:uncharacterized protein BT62DRAFT_932957 [Guyanagaster necrorhizus MCA 3950]KAG7445793.1 hypothetical protein BT62DRAFT_932957 [Guyanagaster necrorhizus MCA 3950]